MLGRLRAKAVLHLRRRDDGTHQVRIRLTKDRISCFLDSGFTVFEKHWNAKGGDQCTWVRKGEELHEQMNTSLFKLHTLSQDYSRAYPELTVFEIRDLLKLPVEVSAADLKRLIKIADLKRQDATRIPIVLRHYQELVQEIKQLHRELRVIKTQLKILMDERRGPATA